jgi:hypothetical protein
MIRVYKPGYRRPAALLLAPLYLLRQDEAGDRPGGLKT